MSMTLSQNRHLKRVVSILIVLTLLVSFCVPLAFAAGDPMLIVSSAEAAPGENVSVTLSIVNNPGLACAVFLVSYGNGLTLISVEGGDFGPANDYGFYYVGEDDFTNVYKDGIIAVFNFVVNDNATQGATISVTAVNDSSFSGGMILDEDFVEYCYTATPGTITVTGGGSGGDENDDAAYTISPTTTATSADIGTTFDVDIVVSADEDIAAVDAVLDFDTDYVRFVSATINSDAFDGDNSSADQNGLKAFGNSTAVGDGLVVATYKFKAIAAGDAVFSIQDGAVFGKTGDTLNIPATSGAPVSVTINASGDDDDDETTATVGLISNEDFNAAPTGYQVLRYVADTLPTGAYFYGADSEALYYSGETENGKHVFLGFVDASLQTAGLAEVTDKAGTYVTLDYSGDLNGNGITAVDALIAYDLSQGVYANDPDMTAKMRFEADYNNDGAVTIDDARAILFKD